MKTSKEMQLKILDKMRENVENDLYLFKGIEYLTPTPTRWSQKYSLNHKDFEDFELRVKPKGVTITINGVEIPKPLDISDIDNKTRYYCVSDCEEFFCTSHGNLVKFFGSRFVYRTEAEAITASKALFGIEG